MKILFYDIESSDMPLWQKPSGDPEQPHIVELAAALVDSETNKDIALVHSLVCPSGWSISEETMKIHGITEAEARAIGVQEGTVVKMFLGIWSAADIRVAHNEQFDARMTRIATKRYCLESVQDQWKSGAKFCTMRKSTDICKIPNTNGRKGYKLPKLEEAYRYFTGQDMAEKHRALADMRAAQAVYMALRAHGVTPCSG